MTAVDSHTTYYSLTPEQKGSRLRKLHQSLKSSRQQNDHLKEKLADLISNNSISLQAGDDDDISAVLSDVEPLVHSSFPPDSPQRLFWDQQVTYNSLKSKTQMRWHPLIIRFALNLKYLSTSAYKAIRQSGIVHLPSERTLSDYTHWSNPHTGVQREFVEEFARMLDTAAVTHNHCSLSMDEMKIKSGLVFNKQTGMLVGFTDLGSVNHEIELLVNGPQGCDDKQLADHAFVFMARAIFKPSLSVPVAHYFTLNLKGNTIQLMNMSLISNSLHLKCYR